MGADLPRQFDGIRRLKRPPNPLVNQQKLALNGDVQYSLINDLSENNQG